MRYRVVDGDFIKCPKCGEWGVVIQTKVRGKPVLRVRHIGASCYLNYGQEAELELEEPPARLQRLYRLNLILGEKTERVLHTAMRLAGHWYAWLATGRRQSLEAFQRLAASAGFSDIAVVAGYAAKGAIRKETATEHVKSMIAALLADACESLVADKVKAALDAIKA
ncbi:MAG: hypothetical protein QXR31_05490 [Zestosphaera sp.]